MEINRLLVLGNNLREIDYWINQLNLRELAYSTVRITCDKKYLLDGLHEVYFIVVGRQTPELDKLKKFAEKSRLYEIEVEHAG